MSRRTDSLNAYEVGLTSGISDVDTSFPVESTIGLIAPGYLVINPDDPTKREYFKYTIINGSNLEMPNTGFRGLRGSASGASAHLAGARVRAVAVGQWLDDIFSDIEDLEAAQAAFLLLDGTRAMTGDLNMGGKLVQNMTLAPVAADDATSKQYVDTGDDAVRSEFAAADLLLLPLDGTRPMTGPLNMGGFAIENMVDSILADGAITKKYVDDGLALYLPLVGGAMTGPITMITTTLPGLRIMSGTAGANSDHAEIALGSDSDVSAARIVGHRGNASTVTGVILRPHSSGGPVDALVVNVASTLSAVPFQIGSGANTTSIPFSVHRSVGGNDEALNTILSAAAGREGAVIFQQTRNGSEQASLLVNGIGNRVIVEANSLHVDSDTTIADVIITRRAINRAWRWVVASNGDLLAQYAAADEGTWTTALTIPDSPE